MQKTVKNLIIGSVMIAPLALGLSAANGHEPLDDSMNQPVIANNHAYVVDSQGHLVRDGSGHCVRTGSWSEEHALAVCGDAVAEAPVPEEGPAPPPIEKTTLQAEALFDFDKAVLKPKGRAILDEFVTKLKDHREVEVIMTTGYTDRIGSDAYNQKLSERRVAAVKRYMVDQGVEASRIETSGRGEADPVVACDDVKGKENGRNKALIKCLAPNRRVEVEVTVQAQ